MLKDLAREEHMSKFHFARNFKKVTGQAPMKFVCQARVEVAKSFLLSSRLPMKEIAEQVGFPDVYTFSRVFRRLTGLAPTHYVKGLL